MNGFCSILIQLGLKNCLNLNTSVIIVCRCIASQSANNKSIFIWLKLYSQISVVWFFEVSGNRLLGVRFCSIEHIYIYTSERSSSTKLKLNESTKGNAWLSLRDTSPWPATNSEDCDVVRRNR